MRYPQVAFPVKKHQQNQFAGTENHVAPKLQLQRELQKKQFRLRQCKYLGIAPAYMWMKTLFPPSCCNPAK